jgi:hypothetical protein
MVVDPDPCRRTKVASHKHYMSLYLDAGLVDLYRGDLARLSAGKSCIRFRRLDDLPLETVRTILRETMRNRGQ